MLFDDNKKSHRIWMLIIGGLILLTVQVVYMKTQQKRPRFTQQQLKNLRQLTENQDSITAIRKSLEEEIIHLRLKQQPRCEDVKGYQCAHRDEIPEEYTGIAFICKDGKIQAMGTYKDGKLDGLMRGWYENGQLNYKTNYKDGTEDGTDSYWYENGQMLLDGNYKDGREVGLHRMWYENGQLSEKAEYQEGVLISQKCYDLNGNEEKCE